MVIGYFILGLALLAATLLLGRWFVVSEPKRVVGTLRWVAAGAGVVFVCFLLWGGRQALAALLLPALIPLLLRWRELRNRIKAAAGPATGQRSAIETRYFRMTLDHDSWTFDGEVLAGIFAGQRLAALSDNELLRLHEEVRGEPDSRQVLEAYLDRRLGPDWREQGETGAGKDRHAAGAGGAMTREEAFAVLGLEPDASPEAIREAHRRMMQKLHPDHGGSNYLAAKINQAKELLLD